MKISKLVKKLNAMLEKHGDLEVEYIDYNKFYETQECRKVDSISIQYKIAYTKNRYWHKFDTAEKGDKVVNLS